MHNLEFRMDSYSFVETNKGAGAWHGLGEKVNVEGDTGINIITALEKSRANYEVSLQPVVALTPGLVEAMANDEMINAGDLLKYIINGSKATMRLDTEKTLGVVSDTYGIVQNERMFQVLGMLATGKDAKKEDLPVVETAGVLGEGSRVFVSMKFPEPIRINTKKDDIINMYLIAQNDHTGMGNFSITVSPIRPVCQNTLMLSDRMAKGRITFRHTRFVNDRIDLLNNETAEMAYRTLGLYGAYKQYFETELEKLRSIRLTEKWCEKILAEALLTEDVFDIYRKNDYSINSDDISTRSKNMLSEAMDSLENGVGQDNRELAGTGLYLINGLTTYFQNTLNWKDKEKKFLSITEGNCYNKLQKAHHLVLEAA